LIYFFEIVCHWGCTIYRGKELRSRGQEAGTETDKGHVMVEQITYGIERPQGTQPWVILSEQGTTGGDK
uniref:Uncharacterized protein n=1 Tax=Anopheles atroparvus TaxID=41427 RepID=A0AAG5D4E1_ANOAO